MPYTGTTVHWSSTYIADIIGDQTIQLPWCTIQTREQKDKKNPACTWIQKLTAGAHGSGSFMTFLGPVSMSTPNSIYSAPIVECNHSVRMSTERVTQTRGMTVYSAFIWIRIYSVCIQSSVLLLDAQLSVHQDQDMAAWGEDICCTEP